MSSDAIQTGVGRGTAVEWVVSCMLELPVELDGQDIGRETRFDALELDSLDLLELLVTIEQRHGIRLPDEFLAAPTVGDVANALAARLADAG